MQSPRWLQLPPLPLPLPPLPLPLQPCCACWLWLGGSLLLLQLLLVLLLLLLVLLVSCFALHCLHLKGACTQSVDGHFHRRHRSWEALSPIPACSAPLRSVE